MQDVLRFYLRYLSIDLVLQSPLMHSDVHVAKEVPLRDGHVYKVVKTWKNIGSEAFRQKVD